MTPRDNWSGQGLIGADISFGYLNKLPMRKRDITNVQKSEQMKSIFGGLGGGSTALKREPTQEGLSEDDEPDCNDIQKSTAQDAVNNIGGPIAYEEAKDNGAGEGCEIIDDGDGSYYDEEEDGDATNGMQNYEEAWSEVEEQLMIAA